MTSKREEASQKIGLDYLFELDNLRTADSPSQHSSEQQSAPSQTGLDAPQAFAAKALLEKVALLEIARDDGVRLSEVSEHTGLSAEVLVPLGRRLTEMGMLDVVERNAFGDDSVRLSSEARSLVGKDDVKLMERLGLT